MLLDSDPKHGHTVCEANKIKYGCHSKAILQQSDCFQEYIITARKLIGLITDGCPCLGCKIVILIAQVNQGIKCRGVNKDHEL